MALCGTANQRSRHGVTLMELLLVLSLLVVFAALAWPSLDRAFDSRRLQVAAEQLRVDLAATRMKSINTGRVFIVRSLPGESTYTMEPFDDGWSQNTIDPSMDSGNVDPQNRPADLMIVQRTLPENILFYAAQGVLDARDEETVAEVTEADRTMGTPTEQRQAEMFFCYPDGSTATARFYLANARNRCIAVDVRGLTGVATLSEVMAVEEIP